MHSKSMLLELLLLKGLMGKLNQRLKSQNEAFHRFLEKNLLSSICDTFYSLDIYRVSFTVYFDVFIERTENAC